MNSTVMIILCIVLWGAWGLTSKLSNVHNSPIFVTVASNFIYAIFSIPLLWKLKKQTAPIDWSFSASSWILLTGALGVSAKLIFNMALTKGPASQIVAATSVFPVVTMLLAVVFLKERLSLTQGLGMALCILGVYLVTLEK